MEQELPQSESTRKPRYAPRKWAGWLILLGLAAACGFWLSSFLLPRWVEGRLRTIANASTYSIRWDDPVWSLFGVDVARIELEQAPLALSLEGVSADWNLRNLREGRLHSFYANEAHLELDLLSVLPAPLQPAAPPEAPESLRPELVRPAPSAPSSGPPPSPIAPDQPEWWMLLPPVDVLQLPRLHLRMQGETSEWPLSGVVQYHQQEGHAAMEWLLYGEDLDLEWGADRSALPEAAWSARARMIWDRPLERIKALLPEQHSLHPEQWLRAGAAFERLSRVRAEWIGKGRQGEIDAWTGLLEGDFTSLRWPGGHLSAPMWMVAVGADNRDIHLQAGVSVDFWQHQDWIAENFQLNLERTPSGQLRLETPELGWRHRSGWQGTMSARYFADWPILFQPVREGELQIAFHALSGAGIQIQPFRFFLNLKEQAWSGRMSALESSRFPGWSLVETRLDGEQLANGGHRLAFDTVLEHTARGRDSARVQGRFNFEDASTFSTGTVRAPGQGPLLATWSVRADAAALRDVRLGGNWDLSRVLPWLGDHLDGLADWSAVGRVEWSFEAERLDPRNLLSSLVRLTAFVNEVDFGSAQGGWAVEGLNGALRMEARPFPRSLGLQMAQMDRFQLDAMVFDDVELVFSWPMFNRFRVERASARIHGGSVQLDSFHFDPRAPSFATRLVFSSLDAHSARASFPMLPESLSGNIDGVWSLHYRNGRWMCGGLVLRSNESSWLFQGRTSDLRFVLLADLIRELRTSAP